jgi:uncharacterized membrane protein AbrB (regulator of aidB expression)
MVLSFFLTLGLTIYLVYVFLGIYAEKNFIDKVVQVIVIGFFGVLFFCLAGILLICLIKRYMLESFRNIVDIKCRKK